MAEQKFYFRDQYMRGAEYDCAVRLLPLPSIPSNIVAMLHRFEVHTDGGWIEGNVGSVEGDEGVWCAKTPSGELIGIYSTKKGAATALVDRAVDAHAVGKALD